MMQTIDLNADLGEGGSADAGLMQLVTSCNIACGGHAGDAESMRASLRLAQRHNVAAGAHPSFPDRANFGRAKSDLAGQALYTALEQQVVALQAEASLLDMQLTHLKPHGALYNMAAQDIELAAIIAELTAQRLPNAALYGPPNSALQFEADKKKIGFIAEGFVDRAYEPDGALRDRKKPGAMLTDIAVQTQQALDLAKRGAVTSYGGKVIAMPVSTLCVHGDTPGALAAAHAVRQSLEQDGVQLCAAN